MLTKFRLYYILKGVSKLFEYKFIHNYEGKKQNFGVNQSRKG